MFNNEQVSLMAVALLKAVCERAAIEAKPGFKAWTEAQQILALSHARAAARQMFPSNS